MVLGRARLEGLAQRGEDKLGAEVIGEAPPHDATRAEVADDGQIEPAGAGWDESNVASPGPVGSFGQRLAGE